MADWPVVFGATLFLCGLVGGVYYRETQDRAAGRRNGEERRPADRGRTAPSGWRCCGRTQRGAYCAQCGMPATKPAARR